MVEPPPEVREHYKSEIVEAERLIRWRGRLEFVRTQEIIRRHLPSGPLAILDVGGAAGVHAEWLADDGHTVHVLDPMPHHVEQARRLAGPLGPSRRRSVTLVAYREATKVPMRCCCSVRCTASRSGPIACVPARSGSCGQAWRPVFAAAISRFASAARRLGPRASLSSRASSHRRTGPARRSASELDRMPHWFTTAFLDHPSELPDEAAAAGLECIEIVGVEGVAGWTGGHHRPLGRHQSPRGHPLRSPGDRIRAVTTR